VSKSRGEPISAFPAGSTYFEHFCLDLPCVSQAKATIFAVHACEISATTLQVCN